MAASWVGAELHHRDGRQQRWVYLYSHGIVLLKQRRCLLVLSRREQESASEHMVRAVSMGYGPSPGTRGRSADLPSQERCKRRGRGRAQLNADTLA